MLLTVTVLCIYRLTIVCIHCRLLGTPHGNNFPILMDSIYAPVVIENVNNDGSAGIARALFLYLFLHFMCRDNCCGFKFERSMLQWKRGNDLGKQSSGFS